MENADCKIELVGHASLKVHSHGKTFLTDPWYIDPINCNTHSHWPPLVKTIEEIAENTDYIYISHIHPDHFDPDSLEYFNKRIPVYIGDYENKNFRDEISNLGFDVIECPFQSFVKVKGSSFSIAIIESDYGESAAFDSSIVIKTPEATVFNNNDCYLKEPKYQWIKDNCKVDFAFLGYSPASYYPICFEFPELKKNLLLQQASDKRYNDFLSVAEFFQPKLAIPFAMGIRFLHPDMAWQNVSFNCAFEAVKRLSLSSQVRGEVMMPGDFLSADESVSRCEDWSPKSFSMKLQEHIDENSNRNRGIWEKEPPAREDVVEQLESYIRKAWAEYLRQGINLSDTKISYKIGSPYGGERSFIFEGNQMEVVHSVMDDADMRYSYPSGLLQRCLDGEIDWDELHFSNRISVLQNKYCPDYYHLIRSFGGIRS